MSDSIFLTDGNGTITGLVAGSSYSGELVIPEYVGNERITAIGGQAFYYYTGLTAITLPRSITTIGGWAFDGCESLTSIVLLGNITSIGTSAFLNCNSLATVYVKDLNNIPEAISSYAWYNTGSSVSFEKYVDRTKYLVEGGTLTGIADKIRVLNGSNETLTPAEMQTTLDTHNTEMVEVLATQDNLIAQIAAALEGKTVPSGGANVETCTVTLTDYEPNCTTVIYSKLIDGSITTCSTSEGGTTYTDVVCGTIFCINSGGNRLYPTSASGHATHIDEIKYVDETTSYIVYGDCTINMERV